MEFFCRGPAQGRKGGLNQQLIAHHPLQLIILLRIPLANSTGYFSAFILILFITIVETSRLRVFARHNNYVVRQHHKEDDKVRWIVKEEIPLSETEG
jgi:energy-converting hydrogenase Eha subunit H